MVYKNSLGYLNIFPREILLVIIETQLKDYDSILNIIEKIPYYKILGKQLWIRLLKIHFDLTYDLMDTTVYLNPQLTYKTLSLNLSIYYRNIKKMFVKYYYSIKTIIDLNNDDYDGFVLFYKLFEKYYTYLNVLTPITHHSSNIIIDKIWYDNIKSLISTKYKKPKLSCLNSYTFLRIWSPDSVNIKHLFTNSNYNSIVFYHQNTMNYCIVPKTIINGVYFFLELNNISIVT